MNAVELRTLADCVERLKLLEETGRLWGQNMLLEVSGPMLLLTDIETKVRMRRVEEVAVTGAGGGPPPPSAA